MAKKKIREIILDYLGIPRSHRVLTRERRGRNMVREEGTGRLKARELG
jgi:hypothetical protein